MTIGFPHPYNSGHTHTTVVISHPTVSMYRHIARIEDEKSLLEEMLALQSQIREQRERKRIAGTGRAERYSKMFEPVTKSIEKLVPKPTVADLIDVPQPGPAENHLMDVEGAIDLRDEPLQPLKPENLMDAEDAIDLRDEVLQPLKIEPKDEPDLAEPGILYRQALHDVPSRLRDDGLLGLNPDNHRLGHYEYSAEGNILKLNAYDSEDHEYEIDDIDLWKLLLVKSPTKIGLELFDVHEQVLPFVEKYRQIVTDLGLLDDFASVPGFRLRTKYKIAKKTGKFGGSGFLFTTHPPTHPLLIPSDNPGLLRELYLSLAELRAGNNSMRNTVVLLAQQAKRKGILPENLLSADEETWVFA